MLDVQQLHTGRKGTPTKQFWAVTSICGFADLRNDSLHVVTQYSRGTLHFEKVVHSSIMLALAHVFFASWAVASVTQLGPTETKAPVINPECICITTASPV